MTVPSDDIILLDHGSGGLLSHELIREVFLTHFTHPGLQELGDAAWLDAHSFLPGRLALTTDSYVVQPLLFPGGDIGKLAVCGTINDLAVAGARPLYLTVAFILEEGLPMEMLQTVVRSMAETARGAGVAIVAGDTKVVERGAADGLFINTTGVGIVPDGLQLGPSYLQEGDAIIISGTIGDHGMAVMVCREGLEFRSDLSSDCAPIYELTARALQAAPGEVRCMRDPTRGGVTTTLNEWAGAGVGIEIDEDSLPIREEVRALCEILGLDPLYSANEGKVLIGVAAPAAEKVLGALQCHPLGQSAAIIGRVVGKHAGTVVLRTSFGSRRIIEMLTGSPLPRIC